MKQNISQAFLKLFKKNLESIHESLSRDQIEGLRRFIDATDEVAEICTDQEFVSNLMICIQMHKSAIQALQETGNLHVLSSIPRESISAKIVKVLSKNNITKLEQLSTIKKSEATKLMKIRYVRDLEMILKSRFLRFASETPLFDHKKQSEKTLQAIKVPFNKFPSYTSSKRILNDYKRKFITVQEFLESGVSYFELKQRYTKRSLISFIDSLKNVGVVIDDGGLGY